MKSDRKMSDETIKFLGLVREVTKHLMKDMTLEEIEEVNKRADERFHLLVNEGQLQMIIDDKTDWIKPK